jgi:hypothetical protein
VLGAIRNLVVLALIVWGAWTLWQWKFGGGDDEMERVAQQSCLDEARSRYDVTAARSHSVQVNSKGFVVKGTMTLARGGNAKLTCLTNHNGRVTEVIVEER